MVRGRRARHHRCVRRWGEERGQTTLEWLTVMVALVALAGALAMATPAAASHITGAFATLICRAGGGACASAPAPAPPAAPPAPTTPSAHPNDPLAVGPPTFQTRTCQKGGRSVSVQFRLQHKRDPQTGKVFNVVDGVSYRLHGPGGTVKLWVFQRAIQTYAGSTGGGPGGEARGPGDLNGAEVLIGEQTVQRDGRAHQLDIGQWTQHDPPVGTYVQPQTNGIFNLHYDYVFVVDPGNDGGGCSFHFDGS
jgi:hypothetical protein